MQQKWWLIAAGAVGIALAILLFPKPATDNLPDPDMSRTDPLDFKADPNERKRPQHVRVASREAQRPDLIQRQALKVAGKEHLATPEAIFSGRLSGPWTLVRRQLLAHGDERAKAWSDKLTPMVTDLRARRRDPEAASWDDLRSRQEALISEIKVEQAWMDIEGVGAQIDRIEDLFASYEADKEQQTERSSADAPPAPAPAPAAPAQPQDGN